MKKEKMLNDVMARDFTVLDLQLFLDTHPDDAEAIATYNEAVKQAAEARKAYESQFGPLSKKCCCKTDAKYEWITEAWPWQSGYMQ